jgi:hypothetical protein
VLPSRENGRSQHSTSAERDEKGRAQEDCGDGQKRELEIAEGGYEKPDPIWTDKATNVAACRDDGQSGCQRKPVSHAAQCLTRPPKTPDNSSKPPSQGQKQDLSAAGADRPPRKSHPDVGRTLHPHPDRTINRRLTTCPNCEAVFPDASQTPQQIYEPIELPPVRPDVTQVRLFGGRCA